jgi:hypothetical protein
MPASRIRTMLLSLNISGYRSIRQLELKDLPPLVIFFGPNGSGKSNILRALRLACRATAWAEELPLDRMGAINLHYADANRELELRPEDFHRPGSPEIRISFTLLIGDAAIKILRSEVEGSLIKSGDELSVSLVFQDVGGGVIRLWWEKAEVGAGITLGPPKDPAKVGLRSQIAQQRAAKENSETQIESLTQQAEVNVANAFAYRQAIRGQQRAAEAAEKAIEMLTKQLGEETLVADRIRRVFLGGAAIQVSEAYRRPEGATEAQLASRFLSAEQAEHESITRLGRRLTKIGLFGPESHNISLRPANSKSFGETQVLISHPTAGELSLRNLGTGEQQLILMLADRVVTPFPISHLEEPEAHLHRSLMVPLASLLLESVSPTDGSENDVDQLWIATHHHLFAISEDFFDVKVTNGETAVERKPRALAAEHFYEPGPLWDALRGLIDAGLDRGSVILRKVDGTTVTVGDIEGSEKGDRKAFNEWITSATQQVILSMKTRASSKK